LDLIRVVESDKDLAPTEQVSDVLRFPALAAMPARQLPGSRRISYISIKICASSRPAAAHGRQPKDVAVDGAHAHTRRRGARLRLVV
jgi:hypothetical protein